MHPIIIDSQPYRLEFRHKTAMGKHPELHPKGSVRAITVCTLVGEEFIASDMAICSMADTFSRKEGRRVAFQKLLKSVGRLKEAKHINFPMALNHLFNGPPKRTVVKRFKPNPEQIAAWKDVDPETVKAERKRRKEQKQMSRARGA